MPYYSKDPKRDHNFDNHPYSKPHKVGNRIKAKSGNPYTLLLRIEAMGFPTFGLFTKKVPQFLNFSKGSIILKVGFGDLF